MRAGASDPLEENKMGGLALCGVVTLVVLVAGVAAIVLLVKLVV